MADMVALDLFWRHKKAAGKSDGTRDIHDWLCENGRFGQKTKAGYYDYDQNRRPFPNAEVDAQIIAISERLGHVRSAFSDEQILHTCMFPLVNEGFKVLEEGFATRPSDIDVVFCFGYGFPESVGGPMHWADGLGLATVRTTLLGLGHQPAALLDECVAAEMGLSEYWAGRSGAHATL